MTSVKSKTLVYIILFGTGKLFFLEFVSTAAFEIPFLVCFQVGFGGMHTFTLPVFKKAQYSHNFLGFIDISKDCYHVEMSVHPLFLHCLSLELADFDRPLSS